jgi:transcriptional regulator with XRE-family HTH domain
MNGFTFGSEVRRLRKQAGLSQAGLGAAATERGTPLDTSAISRIESGQRAIRLDEAALIASILGISLDGIVGLGGADAGDMQACYQAGYAQAMQDVRAFTERSAGS